MGKIETLTINQTVKKLREAGLGMAPGTLADGLEQGVYPFGLCIDTGNDNRVFQIFVKLLDEWIAERAVYASEEHI